MLYKNIGRRIRTKRQERHLTQEKLAELIGRDKVIAMIDELPSAKKVTLADQKDIEAARKAYNALSKANQAKVTNYEDLVEVEEALEALLTAAYLLQLVINGFFPGKDFDYAALENKEPGKLMTVPMIILAVGVVLCGVLSQPLTNVIATAAAAIL